MMMMMMAVYTTTYRSHAPPTLSTTASAVADTNEPTSATFHVLSPENDERTDGWMDGVQCGRRVIQLTAKIQPKLTWVRLKAREWGAWLWCATDSNAYLVNCSLKCNLVAGWPINTSLTGSGKPLKALALFHSFYIPFEDSISI